MEVGHGEKLGLALLHPRAGRGPLALGAMPVAAAVVGDDGVLAVLAARDVAAEGRRAAALNRAHRLRLGKAHVTAVGLTPSGTVIAEDVRDLQGGTGHAPSALLRRLLLLGADRCKPVERAHDRADG